MNRLGVIANHVAATTVASHPPSGSPDPDGKLEFSVVYTDRALNHMSKKFQGVMNDINGMLKEAYNAAGAIIVPGGGTYGMEAVARQFGTGKTCLVVRNGFFSFRWTQIFDSCKIPVSHSVIKAQPVEGGANPSFAPAPLADIVASIKASSPNVVFAPHVETAAGMIMPDGYLKGIADAVHSVGGIFVLDCIASGTAWVDMVAVGVDVLISAPQKGWSGPPAAGFVMLSERGLKVMEGTENTSFSLNLKTWQKVMKTYEGGGHMYHATMPTDALAAARDAMRDTGAQGFPAVKAQQYELGAKVRAMLASKGIKSLAADGFGAPGVVVAYTPKAEPTGSFAGKFAAQNVQIATGVPLMVDNGTNKQSPSFSTFRLGLFGLDKLRNIDSTVATLEAKLDAVLAA